MQRDPLRPLQPATALARMKEPRESLAQPRQRLLESRLRHHSAYSSAPIPTPPSTDHTKGDAGLGATRCACAVSRMNRPQITATPRAILLRRS